MNWSEHKATWSGGARTERWVRDDGVSVRPLTRWDGFERYRVYGADGVVRADLGVFDTWELGRRAADRSIFSLAHMAAKGSA